MRYFFRFLTALLFLAFGVQNNVAQRYCKVVFNAATNSKSFYLIKKGKEIPLNISSEDQLPNSVTHLVLNITNLRPTKYKYIIWKFKDEKAEETNFMTEFNDQYTQGLGLNPSLFGSFLTNLSSLPVTWGDESDDIYENIDAIDKLSKSEVIAQITKSYNKASEIDNLAAEIKILANSDGYTVSALQDVTNDLLKDKLVLDNLSSEKKLEDYMELIYQQFYISNFALEALKKDSLGDEVDRGDHSKIIIPKLRDKFIKSFQNKNQQDLLDYYSDDANLVNTLTGLNDIYEFRKSLYDGSYFTSDTIELDKSSNMLYINGIESVNSLNMEDPATDDGSRGEILKIKLSVKPKINFNYSVGLNYSFFLKTNYKYRFTMPNPLEDTLVVSAVEDFQYFPVIAQSFSIIFDYGKIFNWGFSAFVGFPLFDQAKPTFGLGPSIALGKGKSKLFINASIGFAYQTVLKSDVLLNTPYDPGSFTDFTSNVDYFTTGSYQPTFSLGVGFGISSGGNQPE